MFCHFRGRQSIYDHLSDVSRLSHSFVAEVVNDSRIHVLKHVFTTTQLRYIYSLFRTYAAITDRSDYLKK